MLLIPTSNFFYWLVLNALIGSSVSSLFPYLMVAFSMKSSTPENSSTFRSCPNRRLRLCSLWSHPLRLQQISLPLLDTCHSYAPGLNHYHGDCPLSGGKSRSYFIIIVWLEDSSSGLFVHTKKELGTCPSSKFYYPLNEICTWSLWFAVSPPRSGIWFHVLAGP